MVVRLRPLRRRPAACRPRRDRERLAGKSAAAPAALPCLREVLQPEGSAQPGSGERGLIADARHRTASLRSPSLGVFDPRPDRLRRLDYLLLLAVVTLVGVRALGYRRHHPVRRAGESRPLRHPPDDCRRARRSCDGGGDPDPAVGCPAPLALPLRRHDRGSCSSSSSSRSGARPQALDRSRPRSSAQPSEFGKLYLRRPRSPVSSSSAGCRVGAAWDVSLTAVGLGLVPMGLVFLQPDLGTALVDGAAIDGRTCSSRGALGLHLFAARVHRPRVDPGVLWALPGGRHRGLVAGSDGSAPTGS